MKGSNLTVCPFFVQESYLRNTELHAYIHTYIHIYIYIHAYTSGKTLTGQTGATIPEVLNIAATGYGLKFFLAAAMTPFLYLLKVALI